MANHAGTKGVPRGIKEDQILDIAAAEFGLRGYARASLATIAAAAGISKPLIYSYFGSRDLLHLECVRRAGEPLVEVVASAQIERPAHERASRTPRAVFGARERRRYDWAMLYDPTLPATGAGSEAAHGYRKALNEIGAAGVAQVPASDGNSDTDDRSLLTQIWFGTVTTAVYWWQDHPLNTADDMAARCERIFAGLLRRQP